MKELRKQHTLIVSNLKKKLPTMSHPITIFQTWILEQLEDNIQVKSAMPSIKSKFHPDKALTGNVNVKVSDRAAESSQESIIFIQFTSEKSSQESDILRSKAI